MTRARDERGYDRAGDLVFANEAGLKLSPRSVDRVFKRRLEAADLPKLRIYDLRHTHATLMLANDVHPKVAAERLGHATTRMTLDTYSHVLPGMQDEAVQKLEAELYG